MAAPNKLGHFLNEAQNRPESNSNLQHPKVLSINAFVVIEWTIRAMRSRHVTDAATGVACGSVLRRVR
ncbi:hypothetical protein ACLM45_01645 [Synechococcus sp. A10-1-5-9]|uniref:hypothetical protein n=1 Tax=Synechococcus sp. A10-1-5-9 TaxID=3392295 RepID=UPI0039E864B9